MRQVAPVVAMLTDGSGHVGRSRLDLSRQVCRRASARLTAQPGPLRDADIYRAMLDVDTGVFLRLADRLADWLRSERIDVVVGDAIEGYNPTHDLCRHVIDRAARLAERDRPIANFAFDLIAPPGRSRAPGAVHVTLSPDDLSAKIDVSRDYAAAVGGTLLGEIEALLARSGTSAFSPESLVPVDAAQPIAPPGGPRPFYEAYGEQQVAAGHYRDVIRYEDHVWPIVRALRQ